MINLLNKSDTGEISPPRDVVAQDGPSTRLRNQINRVPSRPIRTGGASRSYGIEAARLAGVPAPVVQRARQVLDQLAA